MNAIAAMDTMELGMTLKRYAKSERYLVVDSLLCLKEFDDRRGYELFHCRSLFEFCRRELGLTEGSSFRRTTAVRILREVPIASEYLRDGRLALSTLVEVRDVLGSGDPVALFDECSRKGRDEVRKIVARLAPVEGPRTALRKLPVRQMPRPDVIKEEATPVAQRMPDSTPPKAPSPTQAPLVLVAPPSVRKLEITVRPVNAQDYAFHATVDQEFVDLLEQVKSLYSHTFPDGDLVEVVRRALQIAAEEKLKKKAAKVRTPQASNAADSEAIPADVRRAVWDRDDGCCAWRYADGHACRSRWMLEFDHIVARALGGKSIVENIRLTCREHNQRHARETYGEDFIAKKRAKR